MHESRWHENRMSSYRELCDFSAWAQKEVQKMRKSENYFWDRSLESNVIICVLFWRKILEMEKISHSLILVALRPHIFLGEINWWETFLSDTKPLNSSVYYTMTNLHVWWVVVLSSSGKPTLLCQTGGVGASPRDDKSRFWHHLCFNDQGKGSRLLNPGLSITSTSKQIIQKSCSKE